MNTLVYTFSLSLFDSLSTTLQIVVFILLLTTVKPLRNTLSYLMGLSGTYFVCGVIGYEVLKPLRAFLSSFWPSSAAVSDSLYYQAEFLMGVVMIAVGIGYFNWKKNRGWSGTENKILLRLQTMTGTFAFGIGFFISLTSFPASVPYILALNKYSTLGFQWPQVIAFILFYNLIYALPMILIFGVYWKIRRGLGEDSMGLREKARILNVHLMTWTMIGFGVFSMIDATFYFALGHALLQERYF